MEVLFGEIAFSRTKAKELHDILPEKKFINQGYIEEYFSA